MSGLLGGLFPSVELLLGIIQGPGTFGLAEVFLVVRYAGHRYLASVLTEAIRAKGLLEIQFEKGGRFNAARRSLLSRGVRQDRGQARVAAGLLSRRSLLQAKHARPRAALENELVLAA